MELEGPRVRRAMEMGLGHWKWAHDNGYTNWALELERLRVRRALKLEGLRVRRALEMGLGY